MPSLTIVDRAGSQRRVDAEIGLSIMEIIRGHGYDELVALCGGCLSCATCHIYFDPAGAQPAPPLTEDEKDLLDGLEAREETSRLSCQIIFTSAHDGAVVTIAPDE